MALGKRTLFSGLIAVVALLAACDESSLPTSVNGQAADATAPTIQSIEAKNEGNGIVTLRVKATDPANAALSFAWRVDAGQLAATTSASVQWRVPKAAGRYTATVDVSNAKGAKVSGTQGFTVDATGQAATTGTLAVQAAAGGKTTTGTGQIPIPAALGSQVPNPPVVGGNPAAPGQPTPTPQTPILQPVATLPPGPTPNPTAPPLQPVATPTPTPPPLVLPPSPVPTARPGTPEPGTIVPPPLTWRQYDPGKVPGVNSLRAMHFLTENKGYIVGTGNAVMLYNKTGAEDPALVRRDPVTAQPITWNRVRFTSDTTGFIAGAGGKIFRTLDAGLTWEDISPAIPNVNFAELFGLVVVNEQIVLVADGTGQIARTASANLASAAQVQGTWTLMPTRPAARPADFPLVIRDGASFPTDPTLSYWVGDGVYRLDADAADPALAWKKLVQTKPPVPGDVGDGLFTTVEMVSQNDVWVGTQTGGHLHTKDGFTTTTRQVQDKYKNREFNGNRAFLTPPGSVSAISAVNAENIFLAGVLRMYDSKDAGASWREMLPTGFNDVQMENTTRDGKPDFVGWGVGDSGKFYIYAPTFP